jgi:hypothetical protein
MSPETGELLIGVDVGTTRIKALALTPDGVQLGAAERVTPWRHEGPHTDVDPVLLAETVTTTCVDVLRVAETQADRPVTALAVGFTGMSETGVLSTPLGSRALRPWPGTTRAPTWPPSRRPAGRRPSARPPGSGVSAALADQGAVAAEDGAERRRSSPAPVGR